MRAETVARTPLLVLDTNAVLDAWVFNDPQMQHLNNAMQAGQVQWVSTLAMRTELEHTLNKAELVRWQPDPAHVLGLFDQLARRVQEATISPSIAPLCRDTSDQKFIDLALAQGCRWLVTHDKALLALARRARANGLSVLRPAQWQLNPS